MDTKTPATRALIARVAQLHDEATAELLAESYPEALELLADGWTLNAALDHVCGSCDVTVCTHPTHDPCAVPGCDRRGGHGHFGLYCQPCSELPYGAGPA